jgi:quercetin dioxygenase-like cupin family protein
MLNIGFNFQEAHFMNQAAFEAELKTAGYTQIETKKLDPRPANDGHGHDYAVRGLVLDGVFTVTQDQRPVTYLAGDVFFVPANKPHTEEIGAQGATVVVGRKY